MEATKTTLREVTLARRALLDDEQRAAAGEALRAALQDLLDHATRVAGYVAVGHEPATAAALAGRDDVLLPVLLPNGDLDWAAGPDVAPAGRGLFEPTGPRLGPDAIASCDVVLVPALAVDRDGNRLGRGGGSYDRALRRATGLTVAILYDDEFLASIPVGPHDVPVAAVATPSYGLVHLSS
jgi:5-formyltetrahydrofolate cyclo-ligase